MKTVTTGMLKRAINDLKKLLAERGVKGCDVYRIQGEWKIRCFAISQRDMRMIPKSYMGFPVIAEFNVLRSNTTPDSDLAAGHDSRVTINGDPNQADHQPARTRKKPCES